MAAPGAGTYSDVEALGAIRDRLILDGTSSEATAPRELVGALNLFLGTSAGEVEGALNEANSTTDLGSVAAINSLLSAVSAFEVNDGLRQLAESYTP
jgi:hypothetical protein